MGVLWTFRVKHTLTHTTKSQGKDSNRTERGLSYSIYYAEIKIYCISYSFLAHAALYFMFVSFLFQTCSSFISKRGESDSIPFSSDFITQVITVISTHLTDCGSRRDTNLAVY